MNEKINWTDQQKAAHKLEEHNQVKTYRMNKAAAAKENCQDIQSTNISPYQNKQACGRALKKLARSLLQSPQKKQFALAKMTKEVGLTVRGQPSCQSQKGLSDVTVKLVTDYYCKNEVSWQAPGRKYCVIIHKLTSSGKKVKKTIQSQCLLRSLKEAYHLFKSEHENVPVGLSKFCDLRPQNVKLFDQIPHNVCVCMYHENVCLTLQELSKHTNLAATFDGFVAQLTCNNSIKECFYHQCEDCKDSIDFFVPPSDVADITTKYQQWQSINKKAEKVQINAIVGDIFDDLKNRLTVFLTHGYVKQIQASLMVNLINSCDGKNILLHVDFSENASLLMQNEIQSAHWNHS